MDNKIFIIHDYTQPRAYIEKQWTFPMQADNHVMQSSTI